MLSAGSFSRLVVHSFPLLRFGMKKWFTEEYEWDIEASALPLSFFVI